MRSSSLPDLLITGGRRVVLLVRGFHFHCDPWSWSSGLKFHLMPRFYFLLTFLRGNGGFGGNLGRRGNCRFFFYHPYDLRVIDKGEYFGMVNWTSSFSLIRRSTSPVFCLKVASSAPSGVLTVRRRASPFFSFTTTVPLITISFPVFLGEEATMGEERALDAER